jgi:ComEC/Rec2-related protein
MSLKHGEKCIATVDNARIGLLESCRQEQARQDWQDEMGDDRPYHRPRIQDANLVSARAAGKNKREEKDTKKEGGGFFRRCGGAPADTLLFGLTVLLLAGNLLGNLLPEVRSPAWETAALAFICIPIAWRIRRVDAQRQPSEQKPKDDVRLQRKVVFLLLLAGVELVVFQVRRTFPEAAAFAAIGNFQQREQRVQTRKKRPPEPAQLLLRVAGEPQRPFEGAVRFEAVIEQGLLAGVRVLVQGSDVPWSALSSVRVGTSLRCRLKVEFLPDIRGRIVNPFSYQAFLLRRGIAGRGRILDVSGVYGNRQRSPAQDRFVRHLVDEFGPSPELAVGLAGATGRADLLDEQTKTTFRNAGLSHLLVVSGYQVGLLFLFCCALFSKLLSRCELLLISCPVQVSAAVSGCLLAALYTYSIGGMMSAVRALFALGIIGTGRAMARRAHTLRSLMIVFDLTLLCWPGAEFEVGFQLIFAALLGLILAARAGRVLRIYFAEQPWKRRLAELCSASLGPALCTTPVILIWFQMLVPLSVVFNILFTAVFSIVFTGFSGCALICCYLQLPGAHWLMRGSLEVGRFCLWLLASLEGWAESSIFCAREVDLLWSVVWAAVLCGLAVAAWILLPGEGLALRDRLWQEHSRRGA